MLKKKQAFPRFSLSGTIILSTYLYILKYGFDSSLYNRALHSRHLATSSSTILNASVMAMSLLNAISHSAVVLGALNDTYVLSILIGVGFDVTTRIVQLIWWVQLSLIVFHQTTISNGEQIRETIFFLVVLSFIYIYHMIIHIQGLRMNKSNERLMHVLQSALNNLRGISGKTESHYYEDDIFAYTDLGGHLAPFYLAYYILKQQDALAQALYALGLLIVASTFTLSFVPLNSNDMYNKGDKSLVKIRGDNIICSCQACKARCKTMGNETAFTFTRREGVCSLWLYSFEELHNIVSSEMKTS